MLDEILLAFENRIKNNEVIGPGECWDIAIKINVLRSEEDDKSVMAEQEFEKAKCVVKEKNPHYSDKRVESDVKTSSVYFNYKKQKNKCDKISETIRLLKGRAKSAGEEYKNY